MAEFVASNGVLVVKNGGSIAVSRDSSDYAHRIALDEAYHSRTVGGSSFYFGDQWDALREFFASGGAE